MILGFKLSKVLKKFFTKITKKKKSQITYEDKKNEDVSILESNECYRIFLNS